MLAILHNGNQIVSVNPARVRCVRPSWSSSGEWPRSVVVFGPEWSGLFLPFWFFFPSTTITVDGSVDHVTEILNAAEAERREPHSAY